MPRLLPLAALLATTGLAAAEVRIGEPVAITAHAREAREVQATVLRAVRTSWGFVAAWHGAGGTSVARVSEDGELLGTRSISLGGRLPGAALATDGHDVIVSYGNTSFGSPVYEAVRLTAAGDVLPFYTFHRQPAAIFWTGSSWLAFDGQCAPDEAVQLDRDGTVLKSVRLRLPARQCDMSRFSNRDPSGVWWLIYQERTDFTEGSSVVRRVALTDERGAPIAGGRIEPVAGLGGDEIRTAGATSAGFFLMSFSAIRFFDFDRQPLGPAVPIDPRTFAATGDGNLAVVAGFLTPGTGELAATRIAPDGRRFAMSSGPVRVSFKKELTVVPARRGAAAFWLDLRTSDPVPMMTILGRGPLQRDRVPTVLNLATPRAFDLTAVAHGDGMLAVWSQEGPIGGEVVASRLDSSARPVGPPVAVLRGYGPVVASNGEIALVAADRTAVRVDRDARVLDGEPIRLPMVPKQVVWDGAAFVVLLVNGESLRIDEFGRVLTPQPVALAGAAFVSQPMALGISPSATMFFFEGLRGGARALFAQQLTHDVVAVGEPQLVSSADPESPLLALWRGDHYLVLFGHAGIVRAMRVSAGGQPLADPFGEYVALEEDGFHAAAVDGLVVVATRTAITEVGARSSTRIDDIGNVRALVTARDGRSWLFTTKDARELSLD